MADVAEQEWKCAGCGIASPNRHRSCTCPTNVVTRRDPYETAWKVGERLEVRPRPDGERGFLRIECLPYKTKEDILREGGTCDVPVRRGPPISNGQAMYWGWDGNAEHPTITPSYQCQACGLHVTITNGIESGRPAPVPSN